MFGTTHTDDTGATTGEEDVHSVLRCLHWRITLCPRIQIGGDEARGRSVSSDPYAAQGQNAATNEGRLNLSHLAHLIKSIFISGRK